MEMRKAFIALTVLAVLVGAAPALGQTVELVIDIDVTIFGDEGEVTKVAEVAVDPALVGTTCDGHATTTNNSSEWDGNDLIIASGGTTTVVHDFEAVANGITFTEGTVELGDTVTLSIRLGPGGVSSEGLRLVLTCQPAPPPTTTTTTTTSTTTTTTTTTTTQPPRPAPTTTTTTTPPLGATTTTESPPVGGVSAGGGSTAATGNLAVAWTMAGFLALLGALALAVRSKRRISSED
jgi:hypothetical protein